jgi:hypothetical protein
MQAVGADHDAGRDRVTSRVHDAAHHTGFAHRASDPHALANLNPATARDLNQGGVQLRAGNRTSKRGSACGVTIIDQVAAAARRPDLHAAQPTTMLAVDAKTFEDIGATRADVLGARFVAGEVGSVDQQHAMSAACQVGRRGAPSRAGTHDDGVIHVFRLMRGSRGR